MSRTRIVSGAIGALTALAVVGGAAVAAASAEPSPRKPTPGLKRFASCEAFAGTARQQALAHIGPFGLGSAGIRRDRLAEGDAAAPTASLGGGAPAAGVDFSGTNLQEAGVDEPDMVKTDGRTIFSVANGRLQAVDVTGGAPRSLGGLDLERMNATGLILMGNRLVVLGDGGGGGVAIDDVARTSISAPGGFYTPSTVVVQLDVSNPAAPRVLARMRVDGTLVSARRTEGTVRLVLSSATSRLAFVSVAEPGAAAERRATRANRRIVARSNASSWLPRLTLRDVGAKKTQRRSAVRCTSVSRPTEFAGLGMINVLTLGITDTMAVIDSDAVMTDGNLVYASPTATYIATTRWSDPAATDAPPRGSTLIHKLDTSDPSRTTYRASGEVPGYLLNQFSMSEHEGFLRAASTEFPTWWTPQGNETSESLVTVLGESGGRLQRVGQVDGLGKGEQIFAVRFLGTRGYVVTFRQTDPLYALDLSDPTRPVVRGELKIPGFSSYLHPVDENTLIGVGQATDSDGRASGTQVSLFDVSDLSAPRRIAQRSLDTAWSEAESDHHAFLYWAPTRTLVLPVQSYGAEGLPTFLGAVGLTVTRETGITPIARVTHPDDPKTTWSPVRRALVVGDALYTVSDTGMKSSALADLAPRGWVAFR